MFKMFLEGVYNNGEVVWLDIKWRVMSLLRRRIYQIVLDNLMVEWVEVMPQESMIKFSDFRGSVVWYYTINEDGLITLHKGWNNSIISHLTQKDSVDTDLINWVRQMTDVDFYKTVDRNLR